MLRYFKGDFKGKRSNLYTKELINVNSGITTVVKLSRLEQVQNYKDSHICLNCRKSIMKIRVYVSETSMIITSSKLFEAFIILIIGLNCITLSMFDPTKEESDTEKRIEVTFQVIYTIEMFLRVFSLGFVLN